MIALELPQLREVADALGARLEEGLAHDGRELKALPAYLAPPPARLAGRALAIDCGGTNLRAAVVELGADGAHVRSGPFGATVPDGRDGRRVTREDFYAAHAELVAKLDGARGLPIGYCFSYPSAVEPDGDARLLAWTKGLHVEGMIGERVGARLVEALASRALEPGPVVVLNDTVAALLAGAPLSAEPARTIGLIVGTGHNLASFFDGARITKIRARGPMAVNLESGNFTPPHLTELDAIVDARSDNPGRQRMEKAVSGYYLPQLFAAARPARASEEVARSGRALRALADDPRDADAPLARALFDRSADLVAAALAGVAAFHDGPVTVLAEGSVYRSDPRYAARVGARLEELLGPGRATVATAEDANLAGAAGAALSKLNDSSVL